MQKLPLLIKASFYPRRLLLTRLFLKSEEGPQADLALLHAVQLHDLQNLPAAVPETSQVHDQVYPDAI